MSDISGTDIQRTIPTDPGLKPLGPRILTKVVKTNPMRGMLYLPEQKNTCEAVVVAVSDELPGFAPGDRVIFDRYGGVDFKHDGVKYLLLTPEVILGKVEA